MREHRFVIVKHCLWLSILCLTLLCTPTFAQSEDSTAIAEEEISESILDKLIVDESVTKLGRDFYEYFFSKWEEPPKVKNYTVYLAERTLPRFGTIVAVRVNDDRIFERFVQPRPTKIEEAADQAIRATLRYLRNYQQTIENLENEDLSGTGIY